MLRAFAKEKLTMIDWRPTTQLDERALDGREVLLATANRLGTADGGDGVRLSPDFPYLYDFATWRRHGDGAWLTREGDYLAREGPTFWAEVSPPDISPATAPRSPK